MNKLTKNIILSILALLLIAVLWYFKTIITYILIASVLSLIGQPLVMQLQKIQLKGKRLPQSLIALISLVCIVGLIVVGIVSITPLVIEQAQMIANIDPEMVLQNLEEPIARVDGLLSNYYSNNGESLRSYIDSTILSVLDVVNLKDLADNIIELTGDLFIAFFSITFILFFLLKDQGLIYRNVLALVPLKKQATFDTTVDNIKRLLSRYFIGICIDVTLIMLIVSVSLSFIGVEGAIVIGVFAGVLNVIPYVGPLIGAAIGISLGLATSLDLDFYTELFPLLIKIATVFACTHLLDGFVFQPFIYSSSINAHPLEIFLVIMVAANLYGIVGMVLAIPSYTVIRVIAREMLIRYNKFVNED